jgi:release factor glutamine methyltransferase
MKAEAWLAQATKRLEKAGIGSARLDSLIILEDVLKKDRSYILAHLEIELSKTRLKKLDGRLKRREKHLPMAYIRGWTEFYGRKFKVNRHVLEPRPESETMITVLKSLPLPPKPSIADVGCGSGALGITAALELDQPNVDLYDIDANCLAVSKNNAAAHELHLHIYKRDLLRKPMRHYDAVLANLPYVPDSWQLNSAAAREPRIAIFGGPDGLEVYRRFFHQLHRFTWTPRFALTEALPPQHEELAKIANKSGYQLYHADDFIQVFLSKN